MSSDTAKTILTSPHGEGVSQCQNSLDSDSDTPHDAAAVAGVVRILLSEAASRHLTATGERAFIVASRVMRGAEEPETMGRWALHFIPCDIVAANAAVGVALGRARAVRIKTPRAAPTPTRDAASDSEQSSRDYGASPGAGCLEEDAPP